MLCRLAILSSRLMPRLPRLSLFFKCIPGPMYRYPDTKAPIQSGWIWRRMLEEACNIMHSSTNNLVCKHKKSFSCHHHFLLLHLALGWDAVGTSCSIKIFVCSSRVCRLFNIQRILLHEATSGFHNVSMHRVMV